MATSVLIIFLMLEQIIHNIADITVGRQEKEMRKQKVQSKNNQSVGSETHQRCVREAEIISLAQRSH